jgi:hypothetical protein
MFGLDKWAQQAHLVSHLIVAAGSWLLEEGNPVFAKIPVAVQPELKAEIQSEVASRQKILAAADAKKA